MTRMKTPAFFDAVPPIVVVDPLAEALGAVEDGIVEYRYADAVKLAGHSCPTVACTWLMTRRALQTLYPAALPRRGDMRVELCANFTGGLPCCGILLLGIGQHHSLSLLPHALDFGFQ